MGLFLAAAEMRDNFGYRHLPQDFLFSELCLMLPLWLLLESDLLSLHTKRARVALPLGLLSVLYELAKGRSLKSTRFGWGVYTPGK